MRFLVTAAVLMTFAAPALAGPVTVPWPVSGPDDTASVATAALSGWYACGDSFENNIEIRDINQTLVHTITQQDLLGLLPWMNLDGGPSTQFAVPGALDVPGAYPMPAHLVVLPRSRP